MSNIRNLILHSACLLLTVLLATGVFAAPPEGKGKAPTLVPPTWIDAEGTVIGLFFASSYSPYGSGICGGPQCSEFTASGNLLIQLAGEPTPRVLRIDEIGRLFGTAELYFDQLNCGGTPYLYGDPKRGIDPVYFINYGLGAYNGIAYGIAAGGTPVNGKAMMSGVDADGTCFEVSVTPLGDYYPATPVFDMSDYVAPFVIVISN